MEKQTLNIDDDDDDDDWYLNINCLPKTENMYP